MMWPVANSSPKREMLVAPILPAIIAKLHGHTIHNVRQLALNMYSYDVGGKAEVTVLRGAGNALVLLAGRKRLTNRS
jgi:hypothetical protein